MLEKWILQSIKSSDLVINVQHREIPYFQSIWPHELTVLVICLEILHSFDFPIAVPKRLIQFYPHEVPRTHVGYLPHIAHTPPSSIFQFAPGASGDGRGKFGKVIWVQLVGVDGRFLLLKHFGMEFDKILFPFPEGDVQLVVVFVAHHILLHSFEAFDLFEDGVGVGIDDREDHAILCPVLSQRFHVFSHACYEVAFGIFELELSIGHC